MKKLLILVTVMVVTAVNTGLISDQVYAYDQGFYSANDILYYNEADKNGCSAGATAALSGNNNLEKVYNYMLSKGLTDFQAAGIVGNISQESGGNPLNAQVGPDTKDPSIFGTAVGVGKAWGLIQWDAGGRAIQYAKQAGITGPIYELATQLDIVWWHMNNTTPTGASGFLSDLKATKTVEEATLLYEQKMEGAGKPAMANRYTAAKLAMSYDKSGAAGVQDTSGCNSATGAAMGNAVQTAINYAWPTYHPAPYLEMTGAYEKAVQAAQAKGLYVGGGIHPGVDCGGFITRVMQDSGVDPEYNKDKGGTTTQIKDIVASGKYIELNHPTTADMHPGDIAINNDHTYMYVGSGNPGFKSNVASASYSTTGQAWRTPMAGTEKPADPNYRWFRLK